MKAAIAACLVAFSLAGSAFAGPASGPPSIGAGSSSPIVEAYWIGRYGQRCYHGPVWLPACHASDTPGVWIPGHWNPMRTRWIPGRYA